MAQWQPFRWPDEPEGNPASWPVMRSRLSRYWGVPPSTLDAIPLEEIMLALRDDRPPNLDGWDD